MENEISGGKIYIQIGAGAGDQDSRTGYRDGFSEYVKNLPSSEIKKIILVEPNPINIPGLEKCWKDYPQANIYQVGIVTKAHSGKTLSFYYAEEDAPHYQVASINPSHVIMHYPHLGINDLKSEQISTIDLTSFIQQSIGSERIELLSLDIEGIEADVLLDTDIASLNINLFSFEHIHLNKKKRAVISHFKRSGYKRVGIGIDHNGYDWLYKKSNPNVDNTSITNTINNLLIRLKNITFWLV